MKEGRNAVKRKIFGRLLAIFLVLGLVMSATVTASADTDDNTVTDVQIVGSTVVTNLGNGVKAVVDPKECWGEVTHHSDGSADTSVFVGLCYSGLAKASAIHSCTLSYPDMQIDDGQNVIGLKKGRVLNYIVYYYSFEQKGAVDVFDISKLRITDISFMKGYSVSLKNVQPSYKVIGFDLTLDTVWSKAAAAKVPGTPYILYSFKPNSTNKICVADNEKAKNTTTYIVAKNTVIRFGFTGFAMKKNKYNGEIRVDYRIDNGRNFTVRAPINKGFSDTNGFTPAFSVKKNMTVTISAPSFTQKS